MINIDFIQIPVEFFALEELNTTEMIVLAIYKFGTEGSHKKCTLSDQEVADIIHMSRRNVIKIKNHLAELGFIKTGKGKEVLFTGTKKGEPQFTAGGEPQFTGGCTTVHSKGEPQFTKKVNHSSLINVKKNKRIEELNKGTSQSQPIEVAGPVCPSSKNNFDTILAMIPGMTPDKETFLRNNIPGYIDKINSISCFDNTVKNDYTKKIVTYLKTNYDNPFS